MTSINIQHKKKLKLTFSLLSGREKRKGDKGKERWGGWGQEKNTRKQNPEVLDQTN